MSAGAPAKFDVLLVQRADSSFYPATISQANLLAEAGLKVVLLDGGKSASGDGPFHPEVSVVRPLAGNNRFDNLRFVSTCRTLLQRCRSVCISFDSPASALLGLLPFSGRKIFHFHEYPIDHSSTWKWRAAVRQGLFDAVASRLARRVDAVSMPDSHRSASFYKENRLSCPPVVVNNCPRRLEALPSGVLRAHLAAAGKNHKYVLIFQGSISLNYYADQIVRSMRRWPVDSVMVFVGRVTAELRALLKTIAADVGVLDRLVFVDQIPYPHVLRYTVDADIALTLIKPVSFNFRYAAGASNKRYEAIACGIPQIADTEPGVRDLIEYPGMGVCVDAENSDEIGDTVANLLADGERRRAMSATARALHLRRLNYEVQFSAMRDRVVAWCAEER